MIILLNDYGRFLREYEVDKNYVKKYTSYRKLNGLQGRVKFPTGGIVHDEVIFITLMNWCDSSTDSRV